MFWKFKIEKAPNVLYKRGPRHLELEQSAISLALLEVYDQRIRHLRAEKMEDVKFINGQAAELAERRAEVFQLRQELQLLRDELCPKVASFSTAFCLFYYLNFHYVFVLYGVNRNKLN